MPRRRHGLALSCLRTAAVLLALGAAQCVCAQEAPLVVGQIPETHSLSLLPPRAVLELLYRRQDDSTENQRDGDTPYQETRFEETLQLATTGSIYHPNLVDLSLAGTLGFTQTWIDDDSATDSESGILHEWDVSTAFLRKEPVGLTLYSRQRRGLLDREFGPSVDTTTTTAGAIVDIRSEWLPSRLEVSHVVEDQEAVSDTPGYTYAQDAVTWHSECRPTDRQEVTWDYSRIWKQESPGEAPEVTFDTQDLTLLHTYRFGAGDDYRLDSTLRDFRQTGEWDRRQRRWDQNLFLRHSEAFSTRYRYALEQNSFGGIDETQRSAETGFTHRLHESLTTNATLGVKDLQRDDGGDSLETYGSLSPEYRKRVPFGQLTVSLSAGLDRQENETRAGVTQVTNSQATFTDDGPIILVGSQIIPASVVVTDSADRVTYTPVLDYTLTAVGDHIELKRVVGGRIANGQRVHIDYQLAPAPANTTTTRTESAGVRYDLQRGLLKGLAAYARYGTQDQDIDTDGILALTPNSYDDTTFGSEYRVWRLTFGLEHRDHDSLIAPFSSDRGSVRYAQRLDTATTLNLNGVYTVTDYPDSGNQVDLLTLGTSVQHQFSERLNASAAVLWRDEDDDLEGPTQGFEQDVQLRWSLRQTSVHLLFRNATLDTGTDSRAYQLVRVGLRREF
jgi:hypothetical protein